VRAAAVVDQLTNRDVKTRYTFEGGRIVFKAERIRSTEDVEDDFLEIAPMSELSTRDEDDFDDGFVLVNLASLPMASMNSICDELAARKAHGVDITPELNALSAMVQVQSKAEGFHADEGTPERAALNNAIDMIAQLRQW
jgi:hypothetical protein